MPMSATSFDSRSSEWMGDLTVWLRQNASDNGEQLDRLRTKLRYARSAELTQRQQQLLRLYFEEGKTMPQIARDPKERRAIAWRRSVSCCTTPCTTAGCG